jgi:hypothetical protein
LKGISGVFLPVGITAKVLLWNAVLDMGLRKAHLARKFSVSPTGVGRLLDLSHSSRIEQIEAALAALGKQLVVGVLEAACVSFKVSVSFLILPDVSSSHEGSKPPPF